MIVVIQCAARKHYDAGHLRTRGGQRVAFVAHPDCAPPGENHLFAHPDDDSDWGKSWRTVLQEYNEASEDNPCGLRQAGQLYREPMYEKLIEFCGPERLFILSAGWGLIRSDFLTPAYDITFSDQVKGNTYKHRRNCDKFHDFNMLPPDTTESITFFGGAAYVELFQTLTVSSSGVRYVWHRSKHEPNVPGCIVKRFYTSRRTNWHYQCAQAFVQGKLEFGGD